MSLSYLFLSVSFVFLVLALDALVKKNHDNIGRFVCISLVANLVSMFSFAMPSNRPQRDTLDLPDHNAERDAPRVVPSEMIIGATQRREAIHHRMNDDLDAMNEMTTNMLINLAEIKGMLRCLDREKYPPFVDGGILPLAPIIQESDLGLSSDDAGLSPDAGAGVSETPK